MQQVLAYNLAKNVNNTTRPVAARRAASAYHLARHPSPHSSSSSLSSLSGEGILSPDSNGMQVMSLFSSFGTSGSPVETIKHSTLPLSASAPSLADTCIEGDSLTATKASPLCIQTEDRDHDHHVIERGDKTNPLMEYFYASANSSDPTDVLSSSSPSLASTVPSVPAPATSLKDSLRGTYHTSTTVLLNQPKRLAQWLGSSSTKLLPSLFTRNFKEDQEDAAIHTSAASGKPPRVPTLSTALPSVVDKADVEEKRSHNAPVRAIENQRSVSPSTSVSSCIPPSSSRFEQEFKILATLGHGGQGTVYKVQSRVDRSTYAIKKVVFSSSEQRSAVVLDQALREVQAMASLAAHPNVVRYHTAWFEKEVRDATTSVEVSHASTVSYESSQFEEDGEISMGGFEFAEPSCAEDTEGEQSTSPSVPRGRQVDVVDMMDVLYIQMELCSTMAEVREEDEQEESERDSFQRLLHRLTSTEPNTTKHLRATEHSTFASWLRTTLEKRACPPEEDQYMTHHQGLELFLDVVFGVQHLHEAGVIHRDLKPDNVFLHTFHPSHSQRTIHAKIGDFGLSKSIQTPDNRMVETLSVDREDVLHTTQLGTFMYASPEQLGYRWNTTTGGHTIQDRVKRATYSVESDIFALGVILLELCSPCTTMMERSQVLTGVRHGVIPQLSRQRFPEEMALVLRMTAMDPTERPSVQDIGQEIRQVLRKKSSLFTPLKRSKSSHTILAPTSTWNEIRDLQVKLDVAVRQLRDRSHTTQQLELLVAELHEKVHRVGLTLA